MDGETIRTNLSTQDPRMTANPFYVVFEWEKLNADPLYSDNWEYGDRYDGYHKICDPGEREKLIDFAKENELNLPPDYLRIDEDDLFDFLAEQYEYLEKFTYHMVRRFVTACFTEAGAEAYIKRDGHNLREPHIYVTSLNRNDEMLSIRRILSNKSFNDEGGGEWWGQ